MSKLYIITRDGKSANDFITEFNLDKKSIVIVKRAADLGSANLGDKYVILRSTVPNMYHWKIRPLLIKLQMVNVTRFYTNKQVIF